MADMSFDLNSSIFAKTPLGQQEIQSRSLGLAPLVRRVLVLIDGKRNNEELALYVPGQNLTQLLDQLMAHGCIEQLQLTSASQPLPAAVLPGIQPAAATDLLDLANLPPADQRTAKDIEMARNFMTNTINAIIGQNVRFTLIKSLHGCVTTAELRSVYPSWKEAISDNRIGLKRLPELQEKLFKVL